MNYYTQKHKSKRAAVQEDLFITRKRTELLCGYLESCGDKADYHVFCKLVPMLNSKTRQQTIQSIDGKKIKKKIGQALMESDFAFTHYLIQAWKDSSVVNKVKDIIINDLQKLIKTQITQEKSNDRKGLLCKRFNKLQTIFNLSDDEMICIIILYLAENDTLTRLLFYTGYSYENAGRIRKIAELSGFSQAKVTRLVAENGRLRRYSIIDDGVDLESHISDFICGLSKRALCSRYYSEFNGLVIDLKKHDTIKDHYDTIISLIKNKPQKQGLNLLFYGSPGVGKTEFARSLGKSLGLNVYEVKNIVANSDDESLVMKRFMALKTCRESIDIEQSIIIIDEADELLNGNTGLSFWGGERNTEKNLVI